MKVLTEKMNIIYGLIVTVMSLLFLHFLYIIIAHTFVILIKVARNRLKVARIGSGFLSLKPNLLCCAICLL